MLNASQTGIGYLVFFFIRLFFIDIAFDKAFEFNSNNGGGGNSKLLDCPTVAGDRRRTGTSMTYPHDHTLTFLLDFIPQIPVIIKICSCFRSDYPGRVGILGLEKFLHFCKQLMCICETDIHNINSFTL